jgi:cobalt-zinc-cadmium efflux system membrane fusion protein
MTFLKSVGGWLWNGFVLAVLAGIGFWGHETDWTFTKWVHHGSHAVHDQPAAHDEHAEHPPEAAVVEFESASDAASAGIRVSAVTRRPMAEFITAPAIVTYMPSAVAHLSARVPGTVWRVERRQGDQVRQGEVLAVLDALAVGDAKAEFLQAMVQAELKQRNLDRLKVAGDGIAEKYLREADAALREAQLERYNAQQALINLGLQVSYDDFTGLDDTERARRMQFLGLPESLVRTLDPETTTANLIPVLAPFDGVLVRCEIVKGEVVSPERSALVLANVDRMLVKLNINKEDALRVAPGQQVQYLADGIPGRITTQIRWISTEVDDKTRAVLAIAELDNAAIDSQAVGETARLLKANTFGVGQIRVREAPTALVVPEPAVQWDGEHHVVFLAREEEHPSEGHRDWVFEPRTVSIGTLLDGFAEITSGINEGEHVVADGSHMLKSELNRRTTQKPRERLTLDGRTDVIRR